MRKATPAWTSGSLAPISVSGSFRVGPVRPYILAGVIGSNLDIQTASVDDSGVHFGYQVGGGIDFKLGPLRPFVEYRWIELDGPGDVNVKYYPLIFGIGIF
jgi:opacity protein-like surface antigen